MSTTVKDDMQSSAVGKLTRSKRLICQWATGCGKSGVVLKFLKAYPCKCLILVPEQNNIQNWLDEFKKFDVSTDDVTIICYASFHKYAYSHWNLLVFDEVPHIDTDKRTAIAKTVTADFVLALGAVIDEDERLALESVYGKFERSLITMSMAMKLNMLPHPNIIIMHMRLDNTVRDRYVNGRYCTMREQYEHVQAKVTKAVNEYNVRSNTFNKQKMLRAGNERKRLLGQFKDEAIAMICNKLDSKKKRYLCFCSSIKQAEMLGGKRAFTSKTPASAKLLEKFNNHEIDSLFVVGKLIEGQNLNDIECGVIGQLGGTPRITIQSIGRIMRSENPVIYLPVFDGTKDDSFLSTITYSIPDYCIQHYNL